MRISQRSIESVREGADIVEVASEFTALRRQGARFVGLCPYPDHQEKTPSFSVSPDKGFYYCFGCLEANELVWTSRGLVPIAAAEVGDRVIGLDGRPETITEKVFKSGPTLKIETGAAREGIELTPDHWCVFVRKEEALRAISGVHLRHAGGKELRFSRKLRGRNLNARLSVEHASEVRPGDFWLYPVAPPEDRADEPLDGQAAIKPYTKGPRTSRILVLPVNPDAAWLYGVWLAEGSLYRGGVKWSFAAHEADTLAERVVRTLARLFGRAATKHLRPNRNLCEVTCSSTDLAALFGRWFGHGCAGKRIPTQALSWTPECQDALIRGYYAGDGHENNGTATAATVSEALAYGVFALCIQAGKVCSLTTTPARTGKDGVGRRKTYSVHILSKESLRGFFAEINGTNYFWSVVREARAAREEPTTVVDIATTGSHTFLTKMGITHNCQRGGDAIKLVGELRGLDFVEAVSHVAERSGIELEYEHASPAARERSERRRAVHRALAAAAVYYQKHLMSDGPGAAEARRYLRDRGFRRPTIEEFRVGHAPPRGGSGFVGAARRLGFDRKTLDAAGLLSSGGRERFAGRITFPISDRRGRIVGFGARALGDDHPKYLNSPETELFNKRDLLYGLHPAADAIRKEKTALVVEGYTDVLMLHQSGIKNAVATLGTATTPAHLKTLSGYADRIVVLFDPDAAGERAVERAATTAAELKLDLRVLRLPEGLDPADWLLKGTPDEFRGLLAEAMPVLEYGIRRIAERARGADATERSRAVPQVQDLMRGINDPVLRREAVRLASEALGVPPETLQQPAPAQQGSSAARPASRPADPHLDAGREVLALILTRPDLTARLLRDGVPIPTLPEPLKLRPEDFARDAQGSLYALLEEHAGQDLDAVLADGRARPLMDGISALLARGERLFPSEAGAREAWLRLAILSRQNAKRRTPDLDAKQKLHTEIGLLKEAQRVVAGP